MKSFHSYSWSTSLFQFLGKNAPLLSDWECIGGGMGGCWHANISMAIQGWIFFSGLTDATIPAKLCKLTNSVNFASVNHHLDWLELRVRLRNGASKGSSCRSLEPGYTPCRFVLLIQTERNRTCATVSMDSESNVYRSSQWQSNDCWVLGRLRQLNIKELLKYW